MNYYHCLQLYVMESIFSNSNKQQYGLSDSQLFTALTLVTALTYAPHLINLSTNESLPLSAAICSGVH